MPTLTHLFRHPIKSLGSEALERVRLEVGRAMPGDRIAAIAHGRSSFDSAAPEWVPRDNFAVIANAPQLAALEVAFDAERRRITFVHRDFGRVSADLSDAIEMGELAAWIGRIVSPVVEGPFRAAALPNGAALADSPLQAVSIKSHASRRALEQRLGRSLDLRRFRGNLWLDEGLAPWEEFDWVGREISVGAARLRVLEPIPRCMATAANPETGARDAFPVKALKQAYDHADFGVLAEVVDASEIAVGDPARVP